MTNNPFLVPSDLPYELPPFDRIEVGHFREAFEQGMTEQLAEIDAIVASTEEPTMANTIDALERSGQILDRASRVFSNQSSSDTSHEVQEIQTEFSPRFAAHTDAILLNPGLFARIDRLHEQRDDLDLDPEARHVLDRFHLDFVRAGAGLDDRAQERLRELNAELASLSTTFGNNLLADTNDSALHLTSRDDLEGMSEDAIEGAAAAAQARDLDGYLITLILPTHQPALESLRNREVRQKLFEASVARGSRGNDHDNTEIARKTVMLRAERAELLGYPTHSDYVLADRTAGTNANVDAMLMQLITPAVAVAKQEQADLAQAMADDLGIDPSEFAAWDWAYYAEAVKRERFDLDTSTLRPYFELERTLRDGVFFAATQLYGITFEERDDLESYHPDARIFEVRNEDGSELGLFIGDFFTRDSKRGGAWMNSLVGQSRLLGQKAVVMNNLNITKPPAGQPALITLDEVGTMFHEFGHALHGLFSDVTYPRVSGTSVARDFVEYPSQVNEMWLTWPEVIANYTRHHETGEQLPQEIIDRIEKAGTFNQGFETVSHIAAVWIDLCWHRLTPDQARNLTGSFQDFEQQALAEVGLDLVTIPPRYSSAYFNHIFASGYSSGYYSYSWSEVLDADTVDWFTESGGLQRRNGDIFRTELLSRGGSGPEMGYFEAFRGRPPQIDALLKRRGLTGA